MVLSLKDLASYLDSYFNSKQFPNDQNGIYRPSPLETQTPNDALASSFAQGVCKEWREIQTPNDALASSFAQGASKEWREIQTPNDALASSFAQGVCKEWRAISRIGLALEPWAELGTWVEQERLDALFLHRPWNLDMPSLPADVGILAYHLAFDLHLTTGFNPRLATVLHMSQPTPFAFKGEIALGMWSDMQPTPLSTIVAQLTDIFGSSPVIEQAFTDTIRSMAVVGAMTDALIREAAEQGVQLYITGQYRQPARTAVHETRMTVAAIGHMSSEQWGLRALAGLLRERWANLEVLLAPEKLSSP